MLAGHVDPEIWVLTIFYVHRVGRARNNVQAKMEMFLQSCPKVRLHRNKVQCDSFLGLYLDDALIICNGN